MIFLIISTLSKVAAFGIPGDPFPGIPYLPIVNPSPDSSNPLITPLNTLTARPIPTTVASPPEPSQIGQATGIPSDPSMTITENIGELSTTENTGETNIPTNTGSESPDNTENSGTSGSTNTGTNPGTNGNARGSPNNGVTLPIGDAGTTGSNNRIPTGGNVPIGEQPAPVVITLAAPAQTLLNSDSLTAFSAEATFAAMSSTAEATLRPTIRPLGPSQTDDQSKDGNNSRKWYILAAAALGILLLVICILWLAFARKSDKKENPPHSGLSDPPEVAFQTVSPVFASNSGGRNNSLPYAQSPGNSSRRGSPEKTFSFPIPPAVTPPAETRQNSVNRSPPIKSRHDSLNYYNSTPPPESRHDYNRPAHVVGPPPAILNHAQRAAEHQSFISAASTNILESDGGIHYWEPTPSESASIAPHELSLSRTQSYNWSQNLEDNRNAENFASKNLEGSTIASANEYQPSDYSVPYMRSTVPKHVYNNNSGAALNSQTMQIRPLSPLRESIFADFQIPPIRKISPPFFPQRTSSNGSIDRLYSPVINSRSGNQRVF